MKSGHMRFMRMYLGLSELPVLATGVVLSEDRYTLLPVVKLTGYLTTEDVVSA